MFILLVIFTSIYKSKQIDKIVVLYDVVPFQKSIVLSRQLQVYYLFISMEQAVDTIQFEDQGLSMIISIDQKWIANQNFLKNQLITCPVCYCIPINHPKECAKCERIFCNDDYQKISNQNSRCPTCKEEPWNVKKDIHITYKHMFDQLILNCILCEGSWKEYRSKQLIEHLENTHHKYLSADLILFDYIFVNQRGQQLGLNLTQNIEINFKRMQGLYKFEIAGSGGRVLVIDLKEMVGTHNQLGKCKIMQIRSRTIRKRQQYLLWIVNISEPNQNEDRIIFYSQQFQPIIEENYQNFQRNNRLNEFHLDVRQSRYRISFSNRTQTNTFTKVEKTIMRLPVKFV